MQTNRQITKALLLTISRSENRSPLFWWMVEHHDQIVASIGGHIRWKVVCAEMAARGLTDTKGNPPTERNARETWVQARAAVAKARVREDAAPKPHHDFYKAPARLPDGWRPEEVSTPPVGRSASLAVSPDAAPIAPTDAVVLTPEAQGEIDRALARLAERDRRKFRFGG